MNQLIKWEEAGLLLLSIFLWAQLHYAWYWWLVWILAPDLSMLAYLGGNRIGAIGYNFVHHRGVAVVVYLLGWYMGERWVEAAGMILLGHSCMDRAMGYGLKYFSGFQDTHLGRIGKDRNKMTN
ncbi:DUF4260 domain-containing protein [Puia dinghuensis]|uniref:DUF4260 family protein n=1 Tax=Puia dinghuensis TaxID=1792502 RepID=A0A8J2XPY6_9BACT|nr:DUF4260 domain-containing protein [Puia dinghuensis]GGA82461.1 hypothetical protein GCM10011511_01790 [Puia dinghuensis]